MATLEISALRKRFGALEILKGIDIMRPQYRAFIFCVVALAPFVTGDCAFAFEPGASFTILPGTTMGIPFAYTGTPGLYLYSLGNYGTDSVPRAASPNLGFGPGAFRADVADEVPALLWTTPWMLFGATYAAGESSPMTVALYNIVNTSTGVIEYNVNMAAAIIAAAPTLLVYVVAGRYFVRGLMAGAVKG